MSTECTIDLSEPKSLDAARRERRDLLELIEENQNWLSSRQKLTWLEYQRTRADKIAFVQKLHKRMRYLREWIAEHSPNHHPNELLLGRAYRVLSRLEDDGVDITEEGKAVLQEVEDTVPLGVLKEMTGR
jgi:hypothetical protein